MGNNFSHKILTGGFMNCELWRDVCGGIGGSLAAAFGLIPGTKPHPDPLHFGEGGTVKCGCE